MEISKSAQIWSEFGSRNNLLTEWKIFMWLESCTATIQKEWSDHRIRKCNDYIQFFQQYMYFLLVAWYNTKKLVLLPVFNLIINYYSPFFVIFLDFWFLLLSGKKRSRMYILVFVYSISQCFFKKAYSSCRSLRATVCTCTWAYRFIFLSSIILF